MKRAMGFLACVLVLAAAAAPAVAAGPMGGGMGGPEFQFFTEFKPVVGGWAEYQVTGEGEKPTKMKIAVVGKEGDAYWFETVTETEEQGLLITKVLVSGSPQDPKNVKRVIVKAGDQPAMEMPTDMIPIPTEEEAAAKEPEGKIVDLGSETVTVPAGKFEAKHLQYREGEIATDAWVSAEVAPYGFVKSVEEDVEMVLLAHGTDAKSLITEVPKKFQMPDMSRMPKMPAPKPVEKR